MSFKRYAKWMGIGVLWAGGLLCSVTVVTAQVSSGVSAALVAGAGNTLRLHIEAGVGVITSMAMTAQGNAVRIDLRGASRGDVQAIAQSMRRQPEVKSARAVFINASEAYVWIELARSYDLLDQTIVAAPGDRSRWELLMTVPGQGAAPGSPIELRDIQLLARDDLLDIRLAGSADLTAEVSILDKPSRLVVELPGATPASVERYVSTFRPGPAPLVKRLTSAVEGGIPRLVFELYDDVDLVDSEGVVSDGQGRIRISLANDKAALARAGALRSIDARLAGRQIDFNLQGVSDASVKTYALDDPPRLVMDVLGMPPEQAEGALARFQSPHPGVLGARLESTRLGSARLVFDLSSSVTLMARGSIQPPVMAGDGYAVAMRTPANPADPGYVAVAVSPPPPVSASRRGPRVDANAPLLVIRPVTLEPPPQTALETLSETSPGLMGLLARAMQQDPRYLAARKDFQISAEAVPQARAGVLPTAMLDLQRSTVGQNVLQASNPTFPTGTSRYINNVATLSITQPLLKMPALVKMDQAARAAEQARFNLMASEQDLMLRLAGAYLNVSAANDGVELAVAERGATEQQYELARARLANGLSNVTQVFDAEARFGLARARELEARNRLDDARQGLKEILGNDAPAVKGFKGDFKAAGPVPAQVDPWVAAALEQNVGLMSRRLAVEIAQLEIKRQQAGYAPTINIVASASRTDSGGSLYGTGQRYLNNELGVRLNLPLYEGGMTSSLVREAVSRQEKSQNEYDQELRKSERQARAAFNGVLASLESQDALRKAVVAQQSALESREEGLRAGLFTPVAVIDSYRLFYTAKRDYLQARYDYLMNRLKLKQAVGILSRGDLEDLNSMLEP